MSRRDRSEDRSRLEFFLWSVSLSDGSQQQQQQTLKSQASLVKVISGGWLCRADGQRSACTRAKQHAGLPQTHHQGASDLSLTSCQPDRFILRVTFSFLILSSHIHVNSFILSTSYSCNACSRFGEAFLAFGLKARVGHLF